MEYYIVSLKHTSKGDTALTFWSKNGSGYTWNRERAGVYTEEEANERKSADSIPVLKEKVDPFWMNAVDFNDEYVSVPNSAPVIQRLGLDFSLMKPKKYASCRMVFLNTPVTQPLNSLKNPTLTL